MTISNTSKVFLTLILSVMMSYVPHIALAQSTQKMISTSQTVEMLSRTAAESKVRAHLDNAELRAALEQYGLSAEEVSSRVASLSDSELNDLARQMEQARYGGDSVGGILVTVLLVVLIIYLIKRL